MKKNNDFKKPLRNVRAFVTAYLKGRGSRHKTAVSHAFREAIK